MMIIYIILRTHMYHRSIATGWAGPARRGRPPGEPVSGVAAVGKGYVTMNIYL